MPGNIPLHQTNTNRQQTKHTIDEAVELTKEFSDTGDGKARSFNNKVLDQISKHFA